MMLSRLSVITLVFSLPCVAMAQAADPGPAAPVAPELEAAPPEQLAVGKEGLFEPGALLQVWLLNQFQDEDHAMTFRIRRAELKARGQIVSDLVAYNVMFDVAKVLEFREEEAPVDDGDGDPATTPGAATVEQPTSNFYSPMQDVELRFLSEYAEVAVGQYKTPLSYEGYNSSSKILFPERAPAARHFGDRRDIGLKVEKRFDYFYYNLGVYNGAGINRLDDDDDQKDVALRLEGYPVEGVTLGAVGYMGVGERDDSDTTDRVEADLKLEFYDALLLAEYLHGWDGPTSAEREEGHGFYVAGAYTFLDRIQPVVRVGMLDENLDQPSSGDDTVWHYEAGMNYYLRGPEARLALTASVFDFKDPSEPTRTDVMLLTQVSF